jgi:hypothetical protein
MTRRRYDPDQSPGKTRMWAWVGLLALGLVSIGLAAVALLS